MRHVDPVRRRIRVIENAVMVGGAIEVGTRKSGDERTVAYPPFLGSDIAIASAGKPRDALLFGEGVSHLRAPDSRRGWWEAAVRRCQAADTYFPRITSHDLRYSSASLAVSVGANVKVVQRTLGHASASMTLDVCADLFDDLETVADALAEARFSAIVGKMWANGAAATTQAPKLPRNNGEDQGPGG